MNYFVKGGLMYMKSVKLKFRVINYNNYEYQLGVHIVSTRCLPQRLHLGSC